MYPPEPWHLRGQMYLSVFLVPMRAVPPLPEVLGAAARPLSLGGRAAVGAAWVDYQPGGVLHYHELLSAVLVHEHGRPRVSITDIWVDSVASREGGRRLWGIPKDIARLCIDGDDDLVDATAATPGGAPLASALVRLRRRLPGRFPFGFTVAQALGGQVKRTPVRGRAGWRTTHAAWRPDPGGPLAYLAGHRPVLSLAVTDFWLVFGRTSRDRAAARNRPA
ncbi:acetoacetate decarboxylase family protein [Actinoplanes teichomyceticus]|uniref:Acetoacetate decarboxylase n=1 Tax=Actinoplanes teichomyceticus TaxID=1867 RepID=A0A561WAB2_ACTTI|nr:acetoacetate decarboxylase family protein [Actinoplanes teichomyceticus]TWG20795.1 acetoacetate decarboxylase [Actinoplanes teichomyceticus]GIF14451.1 acetoacetate decarboxylase [Actinoplanes teichomyceticus]